jgi:predicted ester cyclase
MDADAAKSVVRGYLLEVISEGHWDRWQRYVAEDATLNGRNESLALLQQGLAVVRAALPDFHIVIEDQLVDADGDRVATRVTFSGTHSGEAQGVVPTGQAISYMGIAVDELRLGRVARMWHCADHGGRLARLGLRL